VKVSANDLKSVAIVWENIEVKSMPYIYQYHPSMSLHTIPVSSTPEISLFRNYYVTIHCVDVLCLLLVILLSFAVCLHIGLVSSYLHKLED
jgi:hypothetical protein